MLFPPPQAASLPCAKRINCLECLFDRRGATRSAADGGTLSPSSHTLKGDCVWCASSSVCMPTAAAYANTSSAALSGGVATSPSSSPVVGASPFSSLVACGDIEERSCPAILHDRPPSAHRVTHVSIRKGGPEALLQLYLALSHWGYRVTFDTRHSKKQKGGQIVPFFREAYASELALGPPLRWVKNYEDWHAKCADGDVLIATETWECKRYNDGRTNIDAEELRWHREAGGSNAKGSSASAPLEFYSPRGRAGSRQLQWHLTVWARRDRSECSIAGHTNYVTRTYMRQSGRALLFPYISPHILALAEERRAALGPDAGDALLPSGGNIGLSPSSSSSVALKKKRSLVMYDSDTRLRDEDLAPSTALPHDTKIATGYAPHDLYSLYGEAMVGIDLRLPGGERFIYEAALFDVCVIVDASLNGGDPDDFPVPEPFRAISAIPAGQSLAKGPPSAAFLADLNRAKDLCLREYTATDDPADGGDNGGHSFSRRRRALVESFAPVRRHVRHQRTAFHRHVRRYFSNSVHIVTAVLTPRDASERAIPFVLATLLQMPFATVEVVFASPALRAMVPAAALASLKENSLMAAVTFRVVTTISSNGEQSQKPGNGEQSQKPGAGSDENLSAKLRETFAFLAHNPFDEAALLRNRQSSSSSTSDNSKATIVRNSGLSVAAASRQLYTGVLPISAATGFDGDFAHFLGSLLTLNAAAASEKEGCAAAAAALAAPQEVRRAGLEQANKAAGGELAAAVGSGQQQCADASGFGVGAAVTVGGGGVAALFWRTSDTAEATVAALGVLGVTVPANLRALSPPSPLRFFAVPSAHPRIVRKLSEAEYYREGTPRESSGRSSAPSLGEAAELLVPLSAVFTAPTTTTSVAAPASALRLFFCGHELWQRLAESPESLGTAGVGCPLRIPDAPAGPAV